jgi:tetraacyldisaccharide 4'-kinase
MRNFFSIQDFKITLLICLLLLLGILALVEPENNQIEYLIRLLSDQYKVATLSRGYKDNLFYFGSSHQCRNLGDEPFQFLKNSNKFR